MTRLKNIPRWFVQCRNDAEPLYSADYASRIIIETISHNVKYIAAAQKMVKKIYEPGIQVLKIDKSEFQDRLRRSLDDFDSAELARLCNDLALTLFARFAPDGREADIRNIISRRIEVKFA